ncbi:MAG: hypothetical protein MI919_17690, partial [Holophagales bacterium]|nr:hypothetical protein [Holophagales bacterium]
MASSPPNTPPEGSSPEVASAQTAAPARADGYFTRPRRDRTTRKSVIVADKTARFFITFGGIGTIVSVLGVALFLIYVVLPLFLPAKVGTLEPLEIDRGRLVSLGIDEYQLLGYTLLPSGQLEVFRIDDGRKIEERQLFEDGEMSASSFPIASDSTAFGTRDGVVQLAEIGFQTEILDTEDLPGEVVEQLRNAAEDDAFVDYRGGVLQATPGGQYRFQRLRAEMGATAEISNGPVLQLTHVTTGDGPVVVALVEDRSMEDTGAAVSDPEAAGEPSSAEPAGAGEDGGAPAPGDPASQGLSASAGTGDTAPAGEPVLKLQLVKWAETTNFLTGSSELEMLDPVELPRERDGAPAYLALTGAGVEVLSVWEDGYLERINVRDRDDVFITETGYLLEPGSGESLSFFAPILGGTTFLWGSSSGGAAGGFAVRPEEAESALAGLFESEVRGGSQRSFARTKQLAESSSQAVSLGSSSRSRLALTGFENGEIRLFNITNATQLKRFELPEKAPVIAVTMSPKEDGLLVATPDRLYHADLDPRYPEAGFAAFFRPVWYEGYATPEHIWQSSSGSDDFEMKLGLMPLIFGTLKATFYSMLFGAPLALLAAIFTSEFLHARARGVIKPGIEFMASLPSVVLGFLAALVFAPYVEKVVPASLAVFLTLPVTLLLGAYFWQLLPTRISIRWQNWRFAWMLLLVPVGVVLAGLLGPSIESL